MKPETCCYNCVDNECFVRCAGYKIDEKMCDNCLSSLCENFVPETPEYPKADEAKSEYEPFDINLKAQWTLLDWKVLEQMAKLVTWGSVKHTNYEQGMIDEKKYFDKIFRHLVEAMRGELDPETGLDPLIHAMVDAMIILHRRNK